MVLHGRGLPDAWNLQILSGHHYVPYNRTLQHLGLFDELELCIGIGVQICHKSFQTNSCKIYIAKEGRSQKFFLCRYKISGEV